MKLLRQLHELDAPCAGGVCMTLGVFDGVHRGHQALIARAREEARRRGLRSLVFTFERHPLALLAAAHCPPSLVQPERKADLIASLGVDLCLMLPFTLDFAQTSAEAFIEEILVGRCHSRFITCGGNFSFGAGGKGDTQLLRTRGAELGFEVEIFDPVSVGPSIVSSTRIRDTLIQGHVEEAAEMLTRRYSFEATVVSGHQRGRTIGYPTANLQTEPGQLIPADGVYAAGVRAPDETGTMRSYGGMLNIGRRPTFEGAGRAMEVHLFDFTGELLGKKVEVEFVKRIRDEKKFGALDELIAQLKKDEVTCRTIWTESRQS